MTPFEVEMLRRLLSKANPPTILYRYRRANEWALKEISNHEVHLAQPQDLNDPFEYIAPLSIDIQKIKEVFFSYTQEYLKMDPLSAKKEVDAVDSAHLDLLRKRLYSIRDSSGLICCSATPNSNRMWAYYSDGHKGICIGYRTDYAPFCFAMNVIYQDLGQPIDFIDTWKRDPTEFCDQISRRKGKDWAFEQEFRVPVGQIPENHTRMLPVSPECITEVRLGARIEPDFKRQVVAAISNLPHRPKVIQMGCDLDQCVLTEAECD